MSSPQQDKGRGRLQEEPGREKRARDTRYNPCPATTTVPRRPAPLGASLTTVQRGEAGREGAPGTHHYKGERGLGPGQGARPGASQVKGDGSPTKVRAR